MSKDKKKIKTKTLETLLMDRFGKKVYRVTRVDDAGKSRDFMIVNNSNVEFYLATKKVEGEQEVLDDVRLIKTYEFKEFESVIIDNFAISTKYEFNNGLQLTVEGSKDLTKALQENGISTSTTERKWYNKILGFRSKKKWKMIFASIIYLLFVIAAIDGITESDAEKTERVAAETKQAAEKAEREAQQQIKEAEKKEKEKQDKLAKEEKAKQEKQEREAVMAAFNIASEKLVNESNGVIPEVTIEDNSSYFQVNVYVDEATWARSSESEKQSFATTAGTSIQNALAPHDTFIDVRSATNQDVLASQKLFGGWKIKR